MSGNPVTAEYVLSEEEIREALFLSGKIKKHTAKSLLQTALALLGLALFISNIIAEPLNPLHYIFSGLCLLLIVLVWIYPAVLTRRMVKKAADGKTLRIRLEPGCLTIIGENGEEDRIYLHKKLRMGENDFLYLLFLPDDTVFVLPKRIFTPENFQPAGEYLRTYTSGNDAADAV